MEESIFQIIILVVIGIVRIFGWIGKQRDKAKQRRQQRQQTGSRSSKSRQRRPKTSADIEQERLRRSLEALLKRRQRQQQEEQARLKREQASKIDHPLIAKRPKHPLHDTEYRPPSHDHNAHASPKQIDRAASQRALFSSEHATFQNPWARAVITDACLNHRSMKNQPS